MSPAPETTRVLVVDDEHAIADTMTMILAASHFEARAAYSPLEALSLLDTFNPHAVISDVMMPGMSGIELALHLGDRLPWCKVLLMSGHSSAFELLEKHRRAPIAPRFSANPSARDKSWHSFRVVIRTNRRRPHKAGRTIPD